MWETLILKLNKSVFCDSLPPIYLQFIKSKIAFMLRFLILYLAKIIFWITVQFLDQTAWVKSKFYY